MPQVRPATTGYERLAQADGFSDDSDGDEGAGQGALGASFASLQTAPRPVVGMVSSSLSSSLPPAGAAAAFANRRSSASGAAGHHHYHAQHPHQHMHNTGRGRHRRASSGGVDLKAINARLERWADEIAAKFKRGRKRSGDDDDEESLEIHYSVFQAPEGVRPHTAESLAQLSETEAAAAAAATATAVAAGTTATSTTTRMTKKEFEAIVHSVHTAISQGMHPRMISQGSSGSYFARNPEGKVVGVFKPKDEEPYAAGNPKWNKWIHRNLFPCCFGRACLIPNLSYVSEAAAYVLDAQLRTHLVPYTDVVYLSSRAFHYPFWDRYSHSRNRKPLPAKPGSFQVFLKGFRDANVFLREHPWPDQYLSGVRKTNGRGGRNGGRRRRWADNCRPSSRQARYASGSRSANGSNGSSSGEGTEINDGSGSDYDDDEAEDDDGGSNSNSGSGGGSEPRANRFVWTEASKQSFREELEKLVILDYIMRNTDRGLDNWMIRVDWPSGEVSIASEPMRLNMDAGGGDAGTAGSGGGGSDAGPRPVDLSQRPARDTRARAPYPPYRAPKPMQASLTAAGNGTAPQASITIGAIDNSLSWPWKHPDGWRSFPFGWLFLPVDLIGRPFSAKTREHFLPLLTSTAWWSQTQRALRRVFQMDPDFQERMFARQMAVMKGQAWNVVETLKTVDHGPLELTRRAKVCVWDDLVEVPIAVPMRATSSEMRRRAEEELARAMEEEMDIGAAGASDTASGAAGHHSRNNLSEDLLLGSTSSPPAPADDARLPRGGRFELTKEAVAEEDGGDGDAAEGERTMAAAAAVQPSSSTTSMASATTATSASTATEPLPSRPRLLRASFGGSGGSDGSRAAALNMYTPHRERRFSQTRGVGGGGGGGGGKAHSHSYSYSYSHGQARFANSNRSGGGDNDDGDDFPLYAEDIEGDLGYAAAEGMENNRRRVIVERLEPVKSKNPVFTWC